MSKTLNEIMTKYGLNIVLGFKTEDELLIEHTKFEAKQAISELIDEVIGQDDIINTSFVSSPNARNQLRHDQRQRAKALGIEL